jgi:HAD superfamily hydrolase (TIGR01509 family)
MPRIKAVFFDQDGVIIDTERDGHRAAFNKTFQAFGIDLCWDVEYYHSLLQIGGGKERMKYDFKKNGIFGNLDQSLLVDKIKTLHKYKTDLLIQMITDGKLPLRPGIRRIMEEVNADGLLLGICTTSNEKTAEAIRSTMLADIDFEFILAGDCVSKKKPDPEIYEKAVEKAGIRPDEGIVIEDSHIGTAAAKTAGLNVVATVNGYTKDEDMSNADLVLSCFGGKEQKARVLKKSRAVEEKDLFRLSDLISYFS